MEFAKAQLLKYGWKEGKGLGRHEDGIAEALKPKLKFDNAGVGHDGSEQFTYNWWEHAFNKAAKNVNVHSDENGVVVRADEEIDISTKKYSVLAMKKKKNLEYGTFLKTSTLTNEGKTVNIPKDEEDEEESEKPNISENTICITDEELFRICGGRTAHKGARHGLKLNGKLARIEAHEQQLLQANLDKEEQINITGINSSDGKNQKRNKKMKLNEGIELEIANDIDDVDSFTYQVTKKKKKKRKLDEAIHTEEVVESVEDITSKEDDETDQVTKKKKSKRKLDEAVPAAEKTIESIEDNISCKEDNDTGSPSLTKSKKKKRKVNESAAMPYTEETVEGLEDITCKEDNDIGSLSLPVTKKKKKKKKREVGEVTLLPAEETLENVEQNIPNEEECEIGSLTQQVAKSKKKKTKGGETVVMLPGEETEEYVENNIPSKKKKRKNNKNENAGTR